MGFTCGIVGLPNVGKSTIFNGLTAAAVAAENYPFCTVDPNVGIVEVPDPRLQRVAAEFKPKKVTPTTIEFVDIAGLVKGASHGEGLGNQFLGHIREVDAIAHVVRCFADDQVSHVSAELDPLGDIETISTELYLRDLQTIASQLHRAERSARIGDKSAKLEVELLQQVHEHLAQGRPVRTMHLTEEQRAALAPLCLISAKRVLYVANIGEEDVLAGETNEQVKAVTGFAAAEGAETAVLCGKLEADLAGLDDEERTEFMAEYGLTASGLETLIAAGYRLLQLVTFFSGNENEVRAWTVAAGTLAPQAAGVIHTDFEAGFISAEVFSFADLIQYASVRELREHGLVHTHGRDYVVCDGDVIRFRFRN